MKLLTILIGIVMLGTSSYIGYRAGYAKGLKAEGTASLPDILPAFPIQIQHHYQFQTRGASIFRFDTDTGEAFWLQLSEGDARTPLPQCTQERPIPPGATVGKPQ